MEYYDNYDRENLERLKDFELLDFSARDSIEKAMERIEQLERENEDFEIRIVNYVKRIEDLKGIKPIKIQLHEGEYMCKCGNKFYKKVDYKGNDNSYSYCPVCGQKIDWSEDYEK